jgi:ABC-type glutathione transport system ATPase component
MNTQLSIMPADSNKTERIDIRSENRMTDLRPGKKMEPLKDHRDEPGATVGEPFVEEPRMTCRDVNVYYGDKQAIRNVSVDIAGNEVISMIGPSGCGKSTILRCLNRMNVWRLFL